MLDPNSYVRVQFSKFQEQNKVAGSGARRSERVTLGEFAERGRGDPRDSSAARRPPISVQPDSTETGGEYGLCTPFSNGASRLSASVVFFSNF